MAGSIPDVDDLGVADLRTLVLRLLEDSAALKAGNAALREEILRLKGMKGRPTLRASGMEAATGPKPKGGKGATRRGRGVRPQGPRRQVHKLISDLTLV